MENSNGLFLLSSLVMKIDCNMGWILIIENQCIIILIFQEPMLGGLPIVSYNAGDQLIQ